MYTGTGLPPEEVASAAAVVLVSTLQGLGSHGLSRSSHASRVDGSERPLEHSYSAL